jgi:hypothetical protein
MGLFTCISCNVSYERDLRGAPSFCEDCFTTHTADRGAAIALVNLAIKRGTIPPVRTLQCGCGQPSNVYEHRDYMSPLDVKPACFRCNKRAGAAFNSRYRPATQAA